jgi:hypothetical protein
MLYYQKIKELIKDGNENALPDWVSTQPLSEHLTITQTIRQVLADMLGDEDTVEKKILLQQLDDFSASYNDAVFDEYNATVKYNKAVEERDKAFEEMEKTTAGIRAYLIECVTTNAYNAKEMKELALQIIESEKEYGLYDPQNWKGII